MSYHLIFEGSELAGKSWIMSQVYNRLEKENNVSGLILDGCHWFNCDTGIYGTKYGQPIINYYVKIFKKLKNKNIIVEKFHISDIVYNIMYNNKIINYSTIEKKLYDLGFKIILITFSENTKIIEDRIKGRLKLYPHYKRILKKPEWYIKQQHKYLKIIRKSRLPYFIVNTEILPDDNLISDIFNKINGQFN